MTKFVSLTKTALASMVFWVTAHNTATAQTWNIDKNHTKISFEINHFFTPVEGYFNDFEGSLDFNPDNPEQSSTSFTIKVNSVKTDSEKRDKHLQSADFFNAAKFPEMKFSSTRFEKTDDGYVVKGNLTIRDVTKPVEVPFKVLGRGDHPMKKGMELIAIKGGLTINRNDFGVGTGSWAATTVVGDEVAIKIVIEGNRKK